MSKISKLNKESLLMKMEDLIKEERRIIIQQNYSNFLLNKKTKRRITNPREKYLIRKLVASGRIPKNEYREISSPSKELKRVQKEFLKILEEWEENNIIKISNKSHGFQKGKNIRTNAEQHKGNKFALQIDLKNAFGQITYKRIKDLFAKLGISNQNARLIARLNTQRGIMTQGNPASPKILNIILFHMDNEMSKEIKETYTRYADDITISSKERIPAKVAEEAISIIRRHNCKINKKKVDFQSHNIHLTGITLIKGVLTKRRDHKRLKRYLRHKYQRAGITSQGNQLEHVLNGIDAFSHLCTSGTFNEEKDPI